MDENRGASEDQSKSLTIFSFGVLRSTRQQIVFGTKLVLEVNRSAACEGVEQPACIKSSDPQWSLQHRGQSALPLQLRESEMFDLGSVPYKDSDELCIACVLSAHTLSVQKGSLRYPALFDFAAVLRNEMDVIAASNNHENGQSDGDDLNIWGFIRPPTSEGCGTMAPGVGWLRPA